MTEPLIVHFSIGSAATNTHFSIDVPLDDLLVSTKAIDDVMQLWMKAKLGREIIEKGGIYNGH